jgi:hypothetical protein
VSARRRDGSAPGPRRLETPTTDATLSLDDQHDAYRFVTAEDPDCHEYCSQYVEDVDL